jgi:hypothetical protein
MAVIRLGVYPDLFEEEFAWDLASGRWIGTVEHIMISQTDAWAMDLSNRSIANIRSPNWSRFYAPIVFSRPTSNALRSAITLPVGDGIIPLISVTGFTTSGQIKIREQTVTYTGKSGNDLIGATGGVGTFPANATPVWQGENGGWGTEVVMMDHVSDLWTAGFRLEEQVNCWINGSYDHKAMTIAPWYFNHNTGENITIPPAIGSGGLGRGVNIVGPADDFVDGRATERAFEWRASSWTTWSATAPSKRFLYAGLYGQMPNDANDNGEVYGYTLRHRWIGDPA